MDRAPLFKSGLLFPAFFPVFTDQADDQRDQEQGETDDAGRKPYTGAEHTEQFKRPVISVIPHQRAGIVVNSHSREEHYDQDMLTKGIKKDIL